MVVLHPKASTRFNTSQCFLSLNAQIQKQFKRFWKLEEIEPTIPCTKEQFCEEHFASTYQRDQNGRFIVQLLLKNPVSMLGELQEIAEKRLHTIERKLRKNEDLKKAYTDFIREYGNLGHMNQVEGTTKENENANYLPHHAVIKSRSTTIKVRVVFDASYVKHHQVNLLTIYYVSDQLFKILCSIFYCAFVNIRTSPLAISTKCTDKFCYKWIKEIYSEFYGKQLLEAYKHSV